MSKLATGVLAAVAVSLTTGAVQFALGRDLSGAGQPSSGAEPAAVNRAAKADRAVAVAAPGVQMQTILLHLNGVTDKSVLIRIPLAQATRNGASTPSVSKSGNGATTEACEPAVSVLTEVFKRLPPGRCMT
jgi:hypothetical protein